MWRGQEIQGGSNPDPGPGWPSRDAVGLDPGRSPTLQTTPRGSAGMPPAPPPGDLPGTTRPSGDRAAVHGGAIARSVRPAPQLVPDAGPASGPPRCDPPESSA